jgi:hypothetical protein
MERLGILAQAAPCARFETTLVIIIQGQVQWSHVVSPYLVLHTRCMFLPTWTNAMGLGPRWWLFLKFCRIVLDLKTRH